MDRRDNRYDNMGPRLDLGPAPQPPQRNRTEPLSQQAPYQRQQPPEDKFPADGQAIPPQQDYPPAYHQTTAPAPGYQNQGPPPGLAQNQGHDPGNYQYDSREQRGRAPGRGWADPREEFYDESFLENHQDARHAPGGIMLAKPAPSRWLVVVALVVALAALGLGLFNGRAPTVERETFNIETVPGATAERVAKLEKDVSSLMLKIVTLEKDLEAIKNRSWSPARLNEISNKLNALQTQVESLASAAQLLRQTAAPAEAAHNPAASSTARTAGQGSSPTSAAVASEQIEDRAGSKPDPVSTTMAAPGSQSRPAASAPSGQPRATYTVQRGDTLFSVAQRYQVTTRDLMEWNNMGPDDMLKTGKTLVIY
jgi:LysM repeat protein